MRACSTNDFAFSAQCARSSNSHMGQSAPLTNAYIHLRGSDRRHGRRDHPRRLRHVKPESEAQPPTNSDQCKTGDCPATQQRKPSERNSRETEHEQA